MKNWRLLTLNACTGSLLSLLPVQVLSESIPIFGISDSVLSEEISTQSSNSQIYNLAQSITVRVFSGHTSGSGILIKRQGNTYTVLTNQHVLTPGPPYRIQTPAGRIYSANVAPSNEFYGNDLGLLQFNTNGETYAVATLGNSSNLKPGDQVFAAGFPIEADSSKEMGFTFTTGQISIVPEKPLNRGYRLGYTNDTKQGMSGGPLLNNQGQLIGINGKHAYPLWGDTLGFQDGTQPSETLREQMIRASFAIPVETFLRIARGFSDVDKMPSLNTAPAASQEVPQQLQQMPTFSDPNFSNFTTPSSSKEPLW